MIIIDCVLRFRVVLAAAVDSVAIVILVVVDVVVVEVPTDGIVRPD